MRLQNKSRYPTDEVRALVEFGMRGVRTERLAVHVRNGSSGYAGRAYDYVPDASPRSRQSTVDRLVTIRVGAPSDFPQDNMVTSRRWQRISDEALAAMSPKERGTLRYWQGFDGTHGQDRAIDTRHPYGGKRSPLIVMRDWREALITVAAHEARHVYQFQSDKPRSEVDAEKFAARALARWRAVSR